MALQAMGVKRRFWNIGAVSLGGEIEGSLKLALLAGSSSSASGATCPEGRNHPYENF
jgi:hypothetical protein